MSTIKAKVAAVNKANAYANELYATLRPILAELVGQKIRRADGRLTMKVENMLPEVTFRNGPGVPHVHFCYSDNNSMTWVVKAREEIEGSVGCVYHEVYVKVCSVNNNLLTAVVEFEPRRSDYTVEEIQAKQRAVETAQKALHQAERELSPFTTHNR